MKTAPRIPLFFLGLALPFLPAAASAWGTGNSLADPWIPEPGMMEQATDWLNDLAEEHAAELDAGMGGERAAEVADTASALSDMDRALDEASSRVETDSPPIPLSCAGNNACMECYRAALEQLARQRLLLARLHAVYVATHRFADSAKTTGDGIAGLHQAAGVGWYYQKLRIARSLDTFNQTYDAKFEGMMGVLREVMMEISRCEAEHFNNPDWFNRFGFMYYEFLDARYRRPQA